MPRKKAAEVQTVNAAPNYQPPPPGSTPAPTWQPPTGAPGAFPGGNGVPFTAPPPQGERNPFINALWLWTNGDQSSPLRPITGKIVGLRQATGGNPQYQNRGGFFIDLMLANGSKVTARVNVGDQRHQRLYAKYQSNLMGQVVTIRLSHPGDQTKAPWTVE